MLQKLSGTRRETHPDVLDRRGESGHHMPGDVRERYHRVRVGAGLGDLYRLKMLLIYLYLEILARPQPVRDDDRGAAYLGSKPVLVGDVRMVDGVRPHPFIQGIAVCKKRLALKRGHFVCDESRVARVDMAGIARLAEA